MIFMNCIIIYGSNPRDREKLKAGFPFQNKRHWISWLKEKLEEKGIKVFTPLMPENWRVVYENWKKEFEKLPVDEESILVGHSAGAVFY